MARPKIRRNLNHSPKISYFKPVGLEFGDSKEVILAREEIEALRLVEIKNMSQEKAADSMNISQPTFSRILKSSRKKTAEAIVLGKAIKIEGGNALIHSFSLKDLKNI
jgi:uncharacterized protein